MTILATTTRDGLQVTSPTTRRARHASGSTTFAPGWGYLSENERLELHSFLDIGEGNQIRGMEIRSKDRGRR